MVDFFIDCEWVWGDDLTILGIYCYGYERFQLFDRTLTKRGFLQFMRNCSNAGNVNDAWIFVHGPDVGKIESYFDLDLRGRFNCVNTITAFRKFTRLRTVALSHLERHFSLPRKHCLSVYEINKKWNSGDWNERREVLEYNWEDCKNLWRLVRILLRDRGVRRSDLQQIVL